MLSQLQNYINTFCLIISKLQLLLKMSSMKALTQNQGNRQLHSKQNNFKDADQAIKIPYQLITSLQRKQHQILANLIKNVRFQYDCFDAKYTTFKQQLSALKRHSQQSTKKLKLLSDRKDHKINQVKINQKTHPTQINITKYQHSIRDQKDQQQVVKQKIKQKSLKNKKGANKYKRKNHFTDIMIRKDPLCKVGTFLSSLFICQPYEQIQKLLDYNTSMQYGSLKQNPTQNN